MHVQYTLTKSDCLGYATVRLTGSPIARDLEKTQHGVYREYKNTMGHVSIPSETTRLVCVSADHPYSQPEG